MALLRASLARLACVLAVLLLAGPARADEHLVLWHSYRGDEEKALVAVVHAFEAAHPGSSVEVLAIPFEAYAAKLEAAVPRAHGPDLFIQAHQWIGSYLDENLIAPIGDAFPDADVAGFDAAATAAVTWEDLRYAVPLANKSVALYLNEALVPPPREGGRTTFETLEQLLSIARARDWPIGSYPLAYTADNAYYHAPFLHSFGGRLVEKVEGRSRFGFYDGVFGESAESSLVFVRSMMQRHLIPEEPGGALVKELFLGGRAAAVIDGPWLAADLGSSASIHYRVEPLPKLAATGEPLQPLLTVEAVFATHAGAARPVALALARFLGGPEAALVRAEQGLQVVPRPALWDDPRLAGKPNLRAFHEASKNAVPMDATRAMQATWEPANQAIRKVLRGDEEPGPALAEAKHRWEDATRPLPPERSPMPLVLVSSLGLVAVAAYAVKRALDPTVRRKLRASLPAYAYVTHAVLVVLALVVFPLAAGALTSLFAGTREAPRFIGLANYVGILTARGGDLLGHGSFYLTLLVTILWTAVNVFFHVGIGLVLALALSRPVLKLRAAYRVILILPWAVPSYVTALAWKGMFQRQFGAVNALLRLLGAEPISWFSHFATAFTANVATNVWLGFPFMMVVVLGALTSIPKDVLEAAEVDGATRWQRFRLVTLPLLGPVLTPAVVLGAVWTFNMFNVVFLVSGGEPDGTTDILVSEAYRWAFTRDNQYGYAAAYAVLIFLLLSGGSRLFGRKLTSDAGEPQKAVA
jgi:arabinogalactan oligomer/maltooligosaccharide transport system permease protein